MKTPKYIIIVLAGCLLSGCGAAGAPVAEIPLETDANTSVSDTSHVRMILDKDVLPESASTVSVNIENNGDTSFFYSPEDFSLKIGSGAEADVRKVTKPRDCCMPKSGCSRAGDTTSWTVFAWEFGLTALDPGSYMLCLGDLEAEFTVSAEQN